VTSIDFGVPAGNKDQLDWDGNGAIIGASWATAATDILGDVKTLKAASLKLTGYPLRYAFYGANILGYIVGNTNLSKLIQGNAAMAEAIRNSELPNPFLGLTWIPAEFAYFLDQNGATQSWCGADQVVFTPEISGEVYELLEGSYPVPTSVGEVRADGSAALAADVVEVNGMYSYALLTADPVSIKHVAGDTALPAWLVPNAMFSADVTP
jgi:hypothetical protein